MSEGSSNCSIFSEAPPKTFSPKCTIVIRSRDETNHRGNFIFYAVFMFFFHILLMLVCKWFLLAQGSEKHLIGDFISRIFPLNSRRDFLIQSTFHLAIWIDCTNWKSPNKQRNPPGKIYFFSLSCFGTSWYRSNPIKVNRNLSCDVICQNRIWRISLINQSGINGIIPFWLNW